MNETLSSLLPSQRLSVMDLVEKAGIDVKPWHTTADGRPVKNPKANPSFCYDWAFGSEKEGFLVCIWHGSLKLLDLPTGQAIVYHENFRERALGLDRKAIDRTQPSDERDRARSDPETAVEAIPEIERPKYVDQFSAPVPPTVREATVLIRDRSAAIREAVLMRAGGLCELCNEPGFVTAAGSVYLETHHVVRLAENGPDQETNVVAICPKDHRRAHYAADRDEIAIQLTAILSSKGAMSNQSGSDAVLGFWQGQQTPLKVHMFPARGQHFANAGGCCQLNQQGHLAGDGQARLG